MTKRSSVLLAIMATVAFLLLYPVERYVDGLYAMDSILTRIFVRMKCRVTILHTRGVSIIEGLRPGGRGLAVRIVSAEPTLLTPSRHETLSCIGVGGRSLCYTDYAGVSTRIDLRNGQRHKITDCHVRMLGSDGGRQAYYGCGDDEGRWTLFAYDITSNATVSLFTLPFELLNVALLDAGTLRALCYSDNRLLTIDVATVSAEWSTVDSITIERPSSISQFNEDTILVKLGSRVAVWKVKEKVFQWVPIRANIVAAQLVPTGVEGNTAHSMYLIYATRTRTDQSDIWVFRFMDERSYHLTTIRDSIMCMVTHQPSEKSSSMQSVAADSEEAG